MIMLPKHSSSARGDTFDWWGYYWYEVFIGHTTKFNDIRHCDTYGFKNVSGASGDLLCNGYGQVVSQVPGAIPANMTNAGLVFIGGALITGLADELADVGVGTSLRPPLPPGWDPSWEWRYPEGSSTSSPRWFDPEGGEWRWHPPDKWHPDGHWDYNPWTEWNSPWRNIPSKP